MQRNNENGTAYQRILHGPEGAETTKWCHTAATKLSAASSDKGRRSKILQVARLPGG
jgi:hypothetical protein